MRKAWDSLQRSNGRMASEDVDIQATHLYVKFLPHSSEGLDILARDSTLNLYDYPLDYEIAENGDYYRDPAVPSGQPTPLYCAVEVGYAFPAKVNYEIVEELFIPDDYSDERVASGRLGIDDGWVDELVTEALRLTGNLETAHEHNEESSPNDRSAERARRSRWRPSGRLKIWDREVASETRTRSVHSHWEYYTCDSGGGENGDDDGIIPFAESREIALLRGVDGRMSCRRAVYRTETYTVGGPRYVGLEGVEVRARRWFTTHEGITNSQGDYSCDGTFKRRANYQVQWERWHFKIRDGQSTRGAQHNGPKKTDSWNVNYGSSSGPDKQHYFASIFRPAYHYYYQNRKGLRKPPENGNLRTQLKIATITAPEGECGMVQGAAGCFDHKAWRAFGLSNPVKIWRYDATDRNLYATVIHELAHASHYHMSHWQFRNSEDVVIESWATGVDWELTRMVYTDYEPNYYSRLRYTGIVQDLIDGTDTTATSVYYYDDMGPWSFVPSTKNYSDEVSGYTIRQIEDALRGQRTWNGWKTNIKHRYNNATKNNLDALFSHWNTQ